MNEMKKYHTIKSVSEGKKKKERASVELGLTRHQVNTNQRKEKLDDSRLPKAEEKLELPEKAQPSRPRKKKYKRGLIQMDASSYIWFGGKITPLHVTINEVHTRRLF
jgi:hypothetical protein